VHSRALAQATLAAPEFREGWNTAGGAQAGGFPVRLRASVEVQFPG
jgi:hypothetical protein